MVPPTVLGLQQIQNARLLIEVFDLLVPLGHYTVSTFPEIRMP